MAKIKDHFISRWGPEGCLIEADWSSLELMGWAFLTKDPTLYRLIKSGEDMHRYVGSMVLGCKPEEISEKVRKSLKARNFLLVYGGSAFELTRTHGMSKEDAEHLHKTFWKLFPVAQMVQENWVKQVEASRVLTDEYTTLGQLRHLGHMTSITGRKYFFKTVDESNYMRNKGKMTKFRKPEIYNNTIQGFCTADIHMIALGILFREAIKHRDKFLLINTIHDSVLVDCKKEYLEFTCNLIKNRLEYVIPHLKEKFGIVFDLPLEVELKVGDHWSEMKKYDDRDYGSNNIILPTSKRET